MIVLSRLRAVAHTPSKAQVAAEARAVARTQELHRKEMEWKSEIETLENSVRREEEI